MDRLVVRETIGYLEAALETQAASHKRTEEATAAAAKLTQQQLAQLKDSDKELRMQSLKLSVVEKAHHAAS